MDLKWLLVRRIALAALVCFAAGATFAVYKTAHDAKQENIALVNLVGRQLDLQLSRIDRSTDIPKRFPDWDLIAGMSLQPGQCIQLRGLDGSIQRSNCAGVNAASTDMPPFFLEAYRSIVGELTATRETVHRGAKLGSVVATQDAVATARQAWATIAPLLGLSALLLVVLCVVAYYVIDRALLPANQILAGLNRLGRGDLKSRLPSFRLAEFNRISEVFNALSEDLSKATSESAELARRLVDSQEQERRHVARELHDEIAQKLSALNALAARLRTRAHRDAPALVADTRELESMASGLMLTLRRTLTYLRPQEIDDLGLVPSLEALIARHNDGARGRTRYSIETTGNIERLTAESSAHVYRIVQEALTNAAKHANARNVQVLLHQIDNTNHEAVRLSVLDDGPGPSISLAPSPTSGAGMIGMRERVIALSGSFAAGPLPGGGFGLQIEFPTLQKGP